MKNQAFTKQDRAVFPNLHCFVGTTEKPCMEKPRLERYLLEFLKNSFQ
jgi:hypothetical protein